MRRRLCRVMCHWERSFEGDREIPSIPGISGVALRRITAIYTFSNRRTLNPIIANNSFSIRSIARAREWIINEGYRGRQSEELSYFNKTSCLLRSWTWPQYSNQRPVPRLVSTVALPETYTQGTQHFSPSSRIRRESTEVRGNGVAPGDENT